MQQVGCYSADTGERLHTIRMPVRRVTAVAFGGPALDQLYITSIMEEGEGASPESGKLFVVDVSGAKGAEGAHKYGGSVGSVASANFKTLEGTVSVK